MAVSVPGNSCRSSRCCAPITTGCQFRLPGECVYYSGSAISGPAINPGDTLNVLITKIINYIDGSIGSSTSIIPKTSVDFESDGITCNIPELDGVTFEIFLNDLNRFIYNEVGNQEWDYVAGGGFTILIPGFNANTADYHLYIFPKS